ncbi:uncharacterized protein LOC114679013 [Macaca mulatta]
MRTLFSLPGPSGDQLVGCRPQVFRSVFRIMRSQKKYEEEELGEGLPPLCRRPLGADSQIQEILELLSGSAILYSEKPQLFMTDHRKILERAGRGRRRWSICKAHSLLICRLTC